MNNYVTKNEFLYFQNEILGENKKFENNVSEKIISLFNGLKDSKNILEEKIQELSKQFEELRESVDPKTQNLKIEERFKSVEKKCDDLFDINKIRLSSLEKEIYNISFRYDKIIFENILVPGLIGVSCPYQNLPSFIEYTNKKIQELLYDKTKKTTDLKSYKERMEKILGMINLEMKNTHNKFADYCTKTFKDYEKMTQDKLDIIVGNIDNIRIENGKYSFDLLNKTKELKLEYDKLLSLKEEIYKHNEEDLNKHKILNDNLVKIFNSNKDEFKLLKKRFTELSEFIKDVRFRSNLKNMNNNNNYQEKMKFKKISRKINFKFKQKLYQGEDQSEESKMNNSYNDKNIMKLDNSLTINNQKLEKKHRNSVMYGDGKLLDMIYSEKEKDKINNETSFEIENQSNEKDNIKLKISNKTIRTVKSENKEQENDKNDNIKQLKIDLLNLYSKDKKSISMNGPFFTSLPESNYKSKKYDMNNYNYKEPYGIIKTEKNIESQNEQQNRNKNPSFYIDSNNSNPEIKRNLRLDHQAKGKYFFNEELDILNKKISDLNLGIEKKLNNIFTYIKKKINSAPKRIIDPKVMPKLFSESLRPKILNTIYDINFPLPSKNKKNNSYKNKTLKKLARPKNIKQIQPFNYFRTMVDNLEPYLIKKFQ